MSKSHVLVGSIGVVLAAVLVGCATPSVEQKGASNVDLALKYYREAAELQNEARRLELEAEFYASHQEPDRATHNLEIARDMRIAAAVADEKARSYRAGERIGGQAGLRYE